MEARTHILITGPPGVGKTTLVQKLYKTIKKPVFGFYTEEIRGSNDTRLGFDVVSFDHERNRKPLAREHSEEMGPKIGKYTVLLTEFESIALPCLQKAISEDNGTIVIDEIGISN